MNITAVRFVFANSENSVVVTPQSFTLYYSPRRQVERAVSGNLVITDLGQKRILEVEDWMSYDGYQALHGILFGSEAILVTEEVKFEGDTDFQVLQSFGAFMTEFECSESEYIYRIRYRLEEV